MHRLVRVAEASAKTVEGSSSESADSKKCVECLMAMQDVKVTAEVRTVTARSNISLDCDLAYAFSRAKHSLGLSSYYKRLDSARECDGSASMSTRTSPVPQPVLSLRGSRLSPIKFERLRNQAWKARATKTIQRLLRHATALPLLQIPAELPHLQLLVGRVRPNLHTLHLCRISKGRRFGRPWDRRS